MLNTNIYNNSSSKCLSYVPRPFALKKIDISSEYKDKDQDWYEDLKNKMRWEYDIYDMN